MTHRRFDQVVFGPSSEMPTADNPHGGEKHVARGIYLQTDTGQLWETTGSAWVLLGALTAWPITTVTANYTAAASDLVIVVNAASKTVTLPAAATAGPGTRYIVKNGASGATTTVARSGSDTIDGATSDTTLTSAYNAARYISDGVSAWYTV